jgi:hypothetical protein
MNFKKKYIIDYEDIKGSKCYKKGTRVIKTDLYTY